VVMIYVVVERPARTAEAGICGPTAQCWSSRLSSRACSWRGMRDRGHWRSR